MKAIKGGRLIPSSFFCLYEFFVVNYYEVKFILSIMKHTLALDIPDTACQNSLRIMDASSYASGLSITCPRLDITLPGFKQPLYFTDESELTPGFTRLFTDIDFGEGVSLTGTSSLPDGLYKIRYSISPNDTVYVEYYHLRTTIITNSYYRELCKLNLEECQPSQEQKERMNDLRYIKMYIDGAKAKAEYCHSPSEASKMLSYASSLLSKYKTGCCLTCQ